MLNALPRSCGITGANAVLASAHLEGRLAGVATAGSMGGSNRAGSNAALRRAGALAENRSSVRRQSRSARAGRNGPGAWEGNSEAAVGAALREVARGYP